jgi:hypothetical protein
MEYDIFDKQLLLGANIDLKKISSIESFLKNTLDS